jgi:hypothetical protein
MKCLKMARVGLILLFGITAISAAQSFKVRVINGSNGRPLQNQQVLISLLYDKSQTAPVVDDSSLHRTTDSAGEIEFKLPDVAPAHISVLVRLTSPYWRCGCLAFVSTQDLLLKGVVEDWAASKSKSSVVHRQEMPGLVLFVAYPYSLFWRLLYPLVKG